MTLSLDDTVLAIMRHPSFPRSAPTVCQILHTLDVGGAEILAARLARRLKDDFRFVFGCLDGLGTMGEQLRSEGFPVEVLNRKQGMDIGCVRRLAAFVRDTGAAVIHAHQYTPFVYCRAPGWIGYRPPVLFTEHGRFYPDLPSRKRMVFNRLFLRKTDRVVAVGQTVKQALVDNEGIASARIRVIYNGVRLDDFGNDPRVRRDARAELGIGPDTPVAIQVARLDYLKDHSTALRAAARIRDVFPDFQLLLVGEGPEREKIERQIAKEGLGANVRLLGLRADVRRLLCAADLFLLTSISEGIPVTLIEAMAAELPVVSTSAGGVAEVVLQEQTGRLAPVGNDQALAEASVALLSDPLKRQQLGSSGRTRAQQMFSEATMHAQYAETYRQLIAKQPKLSLSA